MCIVSVFNPRKGLFRLFLSESFQKILDRIQELEQMIYDRDAFLVTWECGVPLRWSYPCCCVSSVQGAPSVPGLRGNFLHPFVGFLEGPLLF